MSKEKAKFYIQAAREELKNLSMAKYKIYLSIKNADFYLMDALKELEDEQSETTSQD